MTHTPKPKVFTDEQMQHLILAYMYSRKDEQVPTEDIAAFLDACSVALFTAESIRMAADGLLFVEWDKATGAFAFALNEAGVRKAEALQ